MIVTVQLVDVSHGTGVDFMATVTLGNLPSFQIPLSIDQLNQAPDRLAMWNAGDALVRAMWTASAGKSDQKLQTFKVAATSDVTGLAFFNYQDNVPVTASAQVTPA